MVTSQNPYLGSNIERITEVPIAELIEEKITKPAEETFVDKGLSIPDSYDIDTIRAMVQDPFHIWVYWTMRPQVFDKLTAIFPKEVAKTFSPVLKLTELKNNDVVFININDAGDYWLSVFPDRHYRIEVGVRSPERGYIRLLEADEVSTPRGTVSINVDPEPEYKIYGQEFVENLRASGFDSFAGVIGPESIMNKVPQPVSEIISSISSGENLQENQIDNLPPRIRALLKELQARGEESLTMLSLLHLLPEYLRETVQEVEDVFDDALHPHHLSPRFMVGASENRPYPKRKPWMPSMTGQWLNH
ncbi:MAG: DUF4912 domain-containing protein [Acidobacteria bacterium]|nr:DUF4912 domain-containing protein [Acidobacteriota bacterium]